MAGFLFRLELADGEPAEPPTLSAAVPDWPIGSRIYLGWRRCAWWTGGTTTATRRPCSSWRTFRRKRCAELQRRGRGLTAATWRVLVGEQVRTPVALPLLCSGTEGSPRLAVMLERVALIPRCAECEAAWLLADEARWQAWLTDDEPPELVTQIRQQSIEGRAARPRACPPRRPSRT
jgi:hypothetical protein